MAFKVYQGKPKVKYFKKTDTTVRFDFGGVVQLNAAGALAVLGNDSDDHVLGVIQQGIAASDSDDRVPVALADESTIWEVDTDSDGGAADSDVGSYVAIDTGDTNNVNASVDVSDTAPPFFYITSIVSATKVRGILARTALRSPAGDSLDS